MGNELVHLAATAAWIFVVLLIFAMIGIYATCSWIAGLFRRGAAKVETGVESIHRKL
jgi:hypothetical protein